jgi:large subunit ribosomal protein L9
MANKVKIIMNQDVTNLGEEGDIRDVAPGYARNFLFPRKLAVPYTSHYLTILNQKKRKIEKRKEEKRIQAQGMKDQIEKEEIVFALQAGENGKLFGSITNGQIAEELQKRGYSVERKRIEVPDHHLKMVGEYTIKVKLYGDEEAELKVSVKALEPTPEELAAKAARTERGRGRGKRSAEAEQVESAGSEEAIESETAEAEASKEAEAGETGDESESDE